MNRSIPSAALVVANILAFSSADVRVALDMNADASGRQHAIAALPGEGVVHAAVMIHDPDGAHSVHTIGYLGGLDRGIACGHVIRNANHGEITGFVAAAGEAVNPGNTGYTFTAFQGAKAFDGPEVQYVEWGAPEAALIRANPPPIFTLIIAYQDALPCDTFDFYVADYVAIWRNLPGFPAAGAFSTTGLNSLDTGGDAVADGTQTLEGIDADLPVPTPPGAYRVDYVDGPVGGGPATIRITWPGDLDGNRSVELADLAILLSHFGAAGGATYADGDITGDGAVTLEDLTTLLAFFGNGCPNG